MSDYTKNFSWRKTLLLPALVVSLLSSVISLAFANDFGTIWALVAAIVSTNILFAVALVDMFRSASEAADMAELRGQIAAMEKRVLRLEDKVSPPADPVRV